MVVFPLEWAMSMAAASDSSWGLLLVGAVATLVAALLTKYGFRRRKKALKLSPGPRNLPIIGALRVVKPPLHRAFERLAAEFGPIVFFRLGYLQTMALVSSAPRAEEVLKHKDLDFAYRSTTMRISAGKHAGFNSAALQWSNYDAQTRLVRKVIGTEFFTAAKIRSHEEIRTHEMAGMVEKILRLSSCCSSAALSDQQPVAPLVAIKDAAFALIQNVMYQLDTGRRFDDLLPNSSLRLVPGLLEDRLKVFKKFEQHGLGPTLNCEFSVAPSISL